ncbi:location of vulva defective 1-like [Dermacentor albipictus]|uniref:location of vulva defective 1-like n=1 Tax=Dermacentor albipictus TaxID=60249 RepID=UPI0031FCE32F
MCCCLIFFGGVLIFLMVVSLTLRGSEPDEDEDDIYRREGGGSSNSTYTLPTTAQSTNESSAEPTSETGEESTTTSSIDTAKPRPLTIRLPTAITTPATSSRATTTPVTTTRVKTTPVTTPVTTPATTTRAAATPATTTRAPATPAPATPATTKPAPSTPATTKRAVATPATTTPTPATPKATKPAPSTPATTTPAPATPATTTPTPATPAPTKPTPSTPAPTTPATTTPAATTTPVATTTPAMSTTPKAAKSNRTTPATPLLCSVGTQAAIAPVFPPDESCDIVIYTHVRVVNGTVIKSHDDISYGAFRNACKAYRYTTCGFSFDIRYLESEGASDIFGNEQIKDDLNTSKHVYRVHHYGILNIYNTSEAVQKQATESAPPILKQFRNLLGEDKQQHKVFVGVGFYFYNSTTAWEDLDYFGDTVATFDVDILVVMSTVVTFPSKAECLAMPVNAYDSANDYTPTLACQVQETILDLEKSAIGLASQPQTQRVVLQTFDTISLMKSKATTILTQPNVRNKLTWLLLNVDLTDSTKRCLKSGPFERVKEFSDFHYQHAQIAKR